MLGSIDGGYCDSPRGAGDKKSIFQRVSKKGGSGVVGKGEKQKKSLLGGGDLSPEDRQLKKMYGVG